MRAILQARRNIKIMQFLVGKPGRKKPFVDLGIDGKITLECIINKTEVRSLGTGERRIKYVLTEQKRSVRI
jgi:hypothetical protein